jgi:hypothetical protein
MGLMDLLKTRANTTPTPAPAPTNTEIDAEVARLEAEVAARAQGTPPLNGDAARAKVPDLPAGAGLAGTGELGKGPFVGVIPPDVPVPGTTGPVAKPIPAEALATMPPPIKAAAAKIAPTTEVAPPAETPAAAATPEKKTPRVGVTLYVDCLVEGAEVESLDAYVAERVAEAHGYDDKCIDIRAASSESPLGYGKWKGVLAALVRATPPAAGAYTLHVEGSEVRQVIAEALKPVCTVYVRGVR